MAITVNIKYERKITVWLDNIFSSARYIIILKYTCVLYVRKIYITHTWKFQTPYDVEKKY